jgi:hypothetical protein
MAGARQRPLLTQPRLVGPPRRPTPPARASRLHARSPYFAAGTAPGLLCILDHRQLLLKSFKSGGGCARARTGRPGCVGGPGRAGPRAAAAIVCACKRLAAQACVPSARGRAEASAVPRACLRGLRSSSHQRTREPAARSEGLPYDGHGESCASGVKRELVRARPWLGVPASPRSVCMCARHAAPAAS